MQCEEYPNKVSNVSTRQRKWWVDWKLSGRSIHGTPGWVTVAARIRSIPNVKMLQWPQLRLALVVRLVVDAGVVFDGFQVGDDLGGERETFPHFASRAGGPGGGSAHG